MADDANIDWAAKMRGRKIEEIVKVLDGIARAVGRDPIVDAESIARFLRTLGKPSWHEIQRYAGFKTDKQPSDETIAGIIDTFTQRVDVAGESL